ncbi:MAG TPA: hypothetical protein VF473_01655 [Cyclobacteriaceae bacterium]
MAYPARLVFTPFVVVVGCKYFFAGAGVPFFIESSVTALWVRTNFLLRRAEHYGLALFLLAIIGNYATPHCHSPFGFALA